MPSRGTINRDIMTTGYENNPSFGLFLYPRAAKGLTQVAGDKVHWLSEMRC